MPVRFSGYRGGVPSVKGRPLLLVRCLKCGHTTVARSPYSETVHGWKLPDRWPYGAPQLSTTVEGVCPKCAD